MYNKGMMCAAAFALFFGLCVSAHPVEAAEVSSWQELEDVVQDAEEGETITVKTPLTADEVLDVPSGVSVTLTGETITRADDFIDTVFSVEGSLTLEDIVVDGNAGQVTAGIGDGSGNSRGVLCRVFDEGELYLENGAVLKNNVTDGIDGAAVSLRSGYCTMEEGARIEGNESSGYGGAVYMDPKGMNSFVMEGGVISKNHSDSYGGALYVSCSQPDLTGFESYGGELTGNSADLGGGAIFAMQTQISLDGMTIADNTAGDSGGAIYGAPGFQEIFVNDCTITGNEAVVSGGGIYTGIANTLYLTDSQLSENTAERQGAGCLISSFVFLRGQVVIQENKLTDETTCNLEMRSSKTIEGLYSNMAYIDQALEEGSRIGITVNDNCYEEGALFALGSDYTVTQKDADAFTDDLEEYGSSLDEKNNGVMFGRHSVELSFMAGDDGTAPVYQLLRSGKDHEQLDFTLKIDGREVKDEETRKKVKFIVKNTEAYSKEHLKGLVVAEIAPGGLVTAGKSGVAEVTMEYDGTVSADKAVVIVPGDTNADGTVNVADALYVTDYIHDPGSMNVAYIQELMDMDASGSVDVADAAIIISVMRKTADYDNSFIDE